jgi:hypothetical protein
LACPARYAQPVQPQLSAEDQPWPPQAPKADGWRSLARAEEPRFARPGLAEEQSAGAQAQWEQRPALRQQRRKPPPQAQEKRTRPTPRRVKTVQPPVRDVPQPPAILPQALQQPQVWPERPRPSGAQVVHFSQPAQLACAPELHASRRRASKYSTGRNSSVPGP